MQTIFSILLILSVFVSFAEARPLSPLEERGKTIYATGKSPSGKPITAWFGKDLLEVPGTSATCSSCHGYDGGGRTESGITATPVGWNYLMKSYGHLHIDGVAHESFDPDSLRSYLRDGVYPGEVRGNPAMPVYDIDDDDMDALLSYMRRLGSEMDPGLTPRGIRVGVAIGKSARDSQAMRETVESYFKEINLRGGIYGRKIEVVPVEGEFPPSSDAATRLAQERDIFTFVSGTAARETGELPVGGDRVPWVGPHGVSPAEAGLPGSVFYLTADLTGEAGALAAAASELSPEKASAVIVAAEGMGSAAAAAADHLRKLGWKNITTVADADSLQAKLQQGTPEVLLVIGPTSRIAGVLQAVMHLPTSPLVFVARTDPAEELPSVLPEKRGKVFLTSGFPQSWDEVSPSGRAAAARYRLPTDNVQYRLSALAAAMVLSEGLKTAGRELSRERLALSLEKMYRFESGVTPPITFGRNTRAGISGAYVYSLGGGGKPNPGWFAVE